MAAAAAPAERKTRKSATEDLKVVECKSHPGRRCFLLRHGFRHLAPVEVPIPEDRSWLDFNLQQYRRTHRHPSDLIWVDATDASNKRLIDLKERIGAAELNLLLYGKGWKLDDDCNNLDVDSLTILAKRLGVDYPEPGTLGEMEKDDPEYYRSSLCKLIQEPFAREEERLDREDKRLLKLLAEEKAPLEVDNLEWAKFLIPYFYELLIGTAFAQDEDLDAYTADELHSYLRVLSQLSDAIDQGAPRDVVTERKHEAFQFGNEIRRQRAIKENQEFWRQPCAPMMRPSHTVRDFIKTFSHHPSYPYESGLGSIDYFFDRQGQLLEEKLGGYDPAFISALSYESGIRQLSNLYNNLLPASTLRDMQARLRTPEEKFVVQPVVDYLSTAGFTVDVVLDSMDVIRALLTAAKIDPTAIEAFTALVNNEKAIRQVYQLEKEVCEARTAAMARTVAEAAAEAVA